MNSFTQTPDEILDYSIDFTQFLKLSDEVDSVDIVAEVIDEDLNPLSITNIQSDNVSTRFYVSGGTLNNRYKITCTMTTVAGIVKETCMYIVIRECQ